MFFLRFLVVFFFSTTTLVTEQRSRQQQMKQERLWGTILSRENVLPIVKIMWAAVRCLLDRHWAANWRQLAVRLTGSSACLSTLKLLEKLVCGRGHICRCRGLNGLWRLWRCVNGACVFYLLVRHFISEFSSGTLPSPLSDTLMRFAATRRRRAWQAATAIRRPEFCLSGQITPCSVRGVKA